MSEIPEVILEPAVTEPAVTANNNDNNKDLRAIFRQFISNSNAERSRNQNDISEIKDSIQGIVHWDGA